MSSHKKIYPRTGDKETVYLKDVVSNPNIQVGEFTIYNDFVNDPRDFEKKKVPPYTIVGGTPAKEIRKRFDEKVASTLQRLKWWDWPAERIAANLPAIQIGDLMNLK